MPLNNYEYNGDLVPCARGLRKEMTPQERRLWYDFLRRYPVKIYRQRVISGFIADFYCASAKLIIELDGGQHFTDGGLAYDAARTEVLEQLGIRVIRFTNHQIEKEFAAVCAEINRVIGARREPLSQPGG